MAQQSGFFNAHLDENGEYDAVYLAEDFAKYFASFIGNGIFGGNSNELMVLENETPSMGVRILPGRAWIDGYWYENSGEETWGLATADGTLDRIDSIVVRWYRASRLIRLSRVTGTPAASPVPPDIHRDGLYYELRLANVYVKAGAVKITQSDITDTRLDSNDCGFVVGLIEQFDTSEFGAQLNAYIADFVAEHDAWKNATQADVDTWVADFKSANDTWFSQFKTDSNSAVDTLLTENQAKVDKLLSDGQTDIDAVVNTGTTNINKVVSDGQTSINNVVSTGSANINKLITDKTTEINQLISTKQTEIDELINENETRFNEKATEFDTLITNGQAEIDRMVAELEEILAGDGEDAESIAQINVKITDITNRVVALESSVKTLVSDMTQCKSDIQSHATSLQTLTQDVTTLKSDVTTLKSDNETLKSDVSGAKTNIVNINDRVSVLEKLSMESSQYPGCFYRIINGNTEWINPPNMPGFEYLTVERWNGNPVYQRTVYTAALPNKTVMSIFFNAPFDKIVSITGFAIDSDNNMHYPFPIILNGLTPIAVISSAEGDGGTGSYITINTNDDLSTFKGYVTVKYTKA